MEHATVTWLEGPPEDFTHDLLLVRDRKLPALGGIVGIVVGVRLRDSKGSSVVWCWKHPDQPVSTKVENRLTKWDKYLYFPLGYPEP